MSNKFTAFKTQIENPFRFRLFLLSKLPMGFISGLKIIKLQQAEASVSVKFKWVNQNPFRSIYFAVLSMAAELSTGVLAFANIYKSNPSVSMLVTKVEAEFLKKAIGKITFTCKDGDAIHNAVNTTIATGEGVTLQCTSIGINEQGEVVARFIFTWSFKAKTNIASA